MLARPLDSDLRMRRTVAFLAAVIVASSAAAVEKIGPTWSEVTGIQYSKAPLNRAPAIIKSIDGRATPYHIVKTEPGIRHIGVQGATRKGLQASSIVMELELAPCKRYYINTQFASATTPDWRPVVDKVESIPGCKLPPATK